MRCFVWLARALWNRVLLGLEALFGTQAPPDHGPPEDEDWMEEDKKEREAEKEKKQPQKKGKKKRKR